MKTIMFLFAFLFIVCLKNNYAQNTWTRKADVRGPERWAAVGFSIGSKGYIGTGHNGNLTLVFRDFWEYDPSTNAWTQKADFGGKARAYATGFSIGSKGYIGTGGVSNRPNGIFNDFWEYDPATNAWTRKADFGGTARETAVGFSIDGKGYIGTGDSGNGFPFSDFWEYDPSKDAWTRKADFGGGARHGAVGFSIGTKGYVGLGGYHEDFWEYDPGMDTWTQKADFGGGVKYDVTGFSIGSKGYIGTGAYDPGIPSYDFWEYDPAADTWTRKADFGGKAREDAVGFSIGNKGYIGTGGSYPYASKDFWEYTPENTCLSPSGLMATRVEDTAAVVKWHLSGANISNVWLRFRTTNDTVWKIRKRDAATVNLRIHGLTPNTTYQWQVRCLCTEDTSGYIKGPDFTTTASFAVSSTTSAITSSKLPGDIHLQIMPNPNKGNFTIQLQLPAKTAITTLALYNNMGERVWQQDAGRIGGAVYKNVSLRDQLPAGVYMMVIQQNDVSLMQKIVINK
jgi:N-acetylneuraminic acid mutarotase